MKRVINRLLMLMAAALVLASCEHNPLFEDLDKITKKNDTIPNVIQEPEKPCSKDTIYFENDILPLLQSNCAIKDCHGDGSAQDGVSLINYNSIIRTGDIRAFNAGKSDLYKAITESDPEEIMPPPPANRLTPEQIAKIATWINQGALNNKCDDCDTTEVTFAKNISPIMQNNCQGCHSGGSPSGGISITNYSQILALADNGKLYGTVSHSPGYVAMPYNQNKLSQCKIDQIKIWVESGAPNN